MTQRAGGSVTLRPMVKAALDKIRVAHIDSVGPITIWHVDGRYIRDHIYIDFTEGGNSQAYVWMPPYEIWLDHDIDAGEQNFVKLHELHEYNRMANDGLGYDRAHDSANKVEGQARRDPAQTSQLWRVEVGKIKVAAKR